MKVSLLAVNYAPSVGGAQIHVRRLAEGLVARHGHDVEVLTTDALLAPAGADAGHVAERRERIDGVLVRRFPVARRAHRVMRNGRRVGLALGRTPRATPGPLAVGPFSARLAVAAVGAARSADAMVGCSSPFTTVAVGPWAARAGRAASVAMPLLHLAAAEPAPAIARALRQLDGCACSTPYERDWVVGNGLAAERTAVLPPGCDPDRYPAITARAARSALGLREAPTVGYVGRLAAYKGVDTLLDAAPALWADHPDLQVLVAGSATGWSGLEERVAGLQSEAKGRLVVRGSFAEAERAQLLAACDVVAFPSREESFGLVTIEAWAARRPVVVADIGAVRCVVRPGIDADLVAPGDATGLAGALGALLDDPERAARYGSAGRARVERDFTWDGMVDGWHALLTDSVGRRRAR